MAGKTLYGNSDYGLRPDGTMGFLKPKESPIKPPIKKAKMKKKNRSKLTIA